MSEPFYDINDVGFSTKKESPKKTITGVEDTEPEEQPEPEVHISSAEWKPGPDGFHYNKQCFLDVKAEYLKLKDNRKTIRARITGKLFGTFNDVEEDMAHTVEGFLNRETGIARLNIKLLWFVNNDHYCAWQNDKSVLAKYVIKNISHSRGVNVIDVGPELEMPVVPEDRWIIFEETAELIDPVFTYEMSKAQAPKNRWIYVFGSEDGSTYARVWEIRTDGSGKKFATFEIDDGNFDSRPEQDQWEDVALLPNKNVDGAPMHFFACISDIRFTKERIFNNEHGLLLNPQCRSSDINDPKQAIRKTLPNDKEKIVLLNTLLHAEMLRKQFDDRYLKWEQIRSSSWFEEKNDSKKEKLIYEFGALIIRIILAYPEYSKHLGPGQYPKLYDQVKEYDDRKITMTKDMYNRVDSLCSFIQSEKFAETCKDYTHLIRKGTSQSEEFYTFEDRVGNLVENITRFPQGAKTIRKLIPEVTTQSEHSWLQDLLLLKNDTWCTSGDYASNDKRTAMSTVKMFQNIRKLTDGFVKLLIEGAKSGITEYKPEKLAVILQTVFDTTGQSINLYISKVNISSDGIKSFPSLIKSFNATSFWRFKIDHVSPHDNILANGLKSDALKRLLLGLEGIALLYSIDDHVKKSGAGKTGILDHLNITLKLLTYFVKSEMIKVKYGGELVKIGPGPIAVANGISSLIETGQAVITGYKELTTYDADAAIFNFLSAAGSVASVVGYGTLATTFFAGVAGATVTGIGIAPGLLLAFTGSVIAMGGKILAAEADNTPIENMLLKTPWGTNPDNPINISTLSTSELQKQYIRAIRVINSFNVSIDHDNISATIHLPRLEPETIVTIHEITFGIPTSSDGSTLNTHIVGTAIRLTDLNCQITKNEMSKTIDLKIDMLKTCLSTRLLLDQSRIYFASFGKDPKPDYIKMVITVDLDGEGMLLLPDEKKKLVVEKHYGQKVKIQVI